LDGLESGELPEVFSYIEHEAKLFQDTPLSRSGNNLATLRGERSGAVADGMSIWQGQKPLFLLRCLGYENMVGVNPLRIPGLD